MSDTSASRKLILDLGRGLLRCGTPAHRVEQTLTAVSHTLGVEACFFCVPTALFAAFGPEGSGYTELIRLESGELNLGKLTRIDACVRGLADGTLTPEDAHDELVAAEIAPPLWGPLQVLLAYAAASASGAQIFGGGLREIALAGLLGLLPGLLAPLLTRRAHARYLFTPVVATVGTALATAAPAVLGPLQVQVVVLAGLLVLLPGLTLTVAMTELATRNLVAGTARLMSAMLIFLELGFGVALGGRVALLLPVVGAPVVNLGPWWMAPMALVVASMSFLVIFQARAREAGWILLSCGIAYWSARLGAQALGPELGAGVGAVATGLAANLYARWKDRPALVPLVPGILLLVPGSLGLRGLSWMMADQTEMALSIGFQTGMIALSLSIGMLLANVMVPPRRSL